MKIKVITLFPNIIESIKEYSIIGRAIKNGLIKLEIIDLRDFGLGKRKTVDDTPYGGGPGMILRPDVIGKTISSIKTGKPRVIVLSPKGKRLNQQIIKKIAEEKDIILVCGHYEGFDQRTLDEADEIVSIGDYVLSGGEMPALVMIDSLARLQKGVLGNKLSAQDESHNKKGRIETPQYTKPEIYKKTKIPAVLLSGNHGEIAKWRKANSYTRN